MFPLPPIATRPAAGIRVILCEPDQKLRAQLRWFIASDPLLILAAEPRDWVECAPVLEELIPELLIINTELMPDDWPAAVEHDSLAPMVITSGRRYRATAPSHIHLDATAADAESIRSALDRAVREIYNRKATQLLYLVNRYVTASETVVTYKSGLKVERDGEVFELDTERIMAVTAARKCVSIHSTDGTFLLREPIHSVASRLDPAKFIRIHRSVLINARHLNYRESASGKGLYAVLVDGTRYHVGPNYRDALANIVEPS
ncbi:MAG TPA: LytTR family transcriptional regulator DNA-binding domain-containing protein [Terriglobales bacterium]|jgi:two-component system LytT family response regulator|nr:LytTR family transcriptional regulator DNA-binding domain-containing protein [Terriglobales bacterium]